MSTHGDEERLEEDQLPVEDTLDDRGLDDQLDEGYSPPERLRGSTAKSVTPRGELEGETIDDRLSQEEPDPQADLTFGPDDPTATEDRVDPPIDATVTDVTDDGEVGGERSGRLTQGEGQPDGFGNDVGIAGGAASAEEAAVHQVPEDRV
jgi:hypothetical protein